ncbi:MAG: esterase/lipase family protein [Bacteriovoracaceae bacterium]
MLKLIICLFLVIGAARAHECASRNHIFLIHGIGGSAKTFGVMDQYLNRANPCNVAQTYEYDTKSTNLSTFDFAKDFNSFIDFTLAKNNFASTDKISLIMHSQGGLIGSLWLISVRESRPDLYSKLDSFITLSTPYYGSKMAKLGRRVLFSLAAKNSNPLSPMGKVQLSDMSYGSSTILFLENSFSEIFEGNQIRFLAVSGEKLISNPEVGEGDTTVSPYSANPNHYAYNISKNVVTESHHLGVVPFTSVIATHIKSTIPGIAYLEKDCLEKTPCDHPSIGIIESQLNGTEVELKKRDFQKFRVHVYLKKIAKNMNVQAVDEEGHHWKAKLTPHADNLMGQAFFDYADDSQERVITLKLRQGKKILRTDRIRIRGGYSTFVTYDSDVQ